MQRCSMGNIHAWQGDWSSQKILIAYLPCPNLLLRSLLTLTYDRLMPDTLKYYQARLP